MDRLVRFTSWLCGSAAAFLVLGLVASSVHTGTGSVHFVPAEHRFDAPLEPMQECHLSLTLRNGTGRPVTLLGAPSFCGSRGCGKLEGFPQVIQPGADGQIDVRFEAGAPGPFAHEIPIYTDCPGQPEVILRLIGEVREEESIDSIPNALPALASESGGPSHESSATGP